MNTEHIKGSELFDLVVQRIKENDLFKNYDFRNNLPQVVTLLLEESCETVANNKPETNDIEIFVYAVMTAFIVGLSALQTLAKSTLGLPDKITLNYKDHSFVVASNSKWLVNLN